MNSLANRPIILCVEDEPTLLRDLCEELEDAGYNPIGVGSTAEAREVLVRGTPALILCDVTLPGESGLEFLADLRRRDALSGVPFMMVTAQSDRNHVLQGKLLGADDYVIKPVDYDLLLASIASRLQQVGRMQRSYAQQLQQQLRAQTDALVAQWTQVLNKVSQCALVCGGDLSVRFANRAAYSLCQSSQASPLAVEATGQIALHASIQRHPKVQAFLRGQAKAMKVDITSASGSGKSWQVTLLALQKCPKAEVDDGTATPASDEVYVLFLADLQQRHLHNKAALAQRFALTPTEVQVASLLTDGLTKAEMCERMGVSAATLAFHLRNLFSKTGTNRQVELVALMMSVAWNDVAITVPAKL